MLIADYLGSLHLIAHDYTVNFQYSMAHWTGYFVVIILVILTFIFLFEIVWYFHIINICGYGQDLIWFRFIFVWNSFC